MAGCSDSFCRLKPRILSPFYRTSIFKCVPRGLPQLHVRSCIPVCKSPLCCVWAVKHPSQQVSIISTSERWTACGFSVCTSVWVPALKLPFGVQGKKTLPGGDWQSKTGRFNSNWNQLKIESLLVNWSAEVKGQHQCCFLTCSFFPVKVKEHFLFDWCLVKTTILRQMTTIVGWNVENMARMVKHSDGIKLKQSKVVVELHFKILIWV